MSENQVNIPLLRKCVEWAEAEAARPFEVSEWYQGHYVLDLESELDIHIRERLGKANECGTCYCIAGYVTAVAGEPMSMADAVGQRELGLTDDQAFNLFGASNTIEQVRRIAEDIAGEPL